MGHPDNRQYAFKLKWWQDWRWVASIAFLIFSLGAIALGITTYHTSTTVEDQTSILTRLDKSQKDLDEITQFLHQVEAQQSTSSSSGNSSQQVVQTLITLLCSSEDPIRQQACKTAGFTGAGG